MDFVVMVEADSETAEVVEPAEGSFGDPSKNAEAAAVLLIPFCQVWFDASLAKFFSDRLGVIGSIGINFIRVILGWPGFPPTGGIASISGRS